MDIARLKELRGEVSNVAFIALSKLVDKNARANVVKFGEDLQELIDEAIARQSVKSEEIQEAIGLLSGKSYGTHNLSCDCVFCKAIDLAITALQAYQPWIPVSEMLPTEDDADEKGLVLTYDKLENQETFPWDKIEEWNATKDNKITHYKPLPEPPKGE